jgi:putative ABC transport system ATP-binding protein
VAGVERRVAGVEQSEPLERSDHSAVFRVAGVELLERSMTRVVMREWLGSLAREPGGSLRSTPATRKRSTPATRHSTAATHHEPSLEFPPAHARVPRPYALHWHEMPHHGGRSATAEPQANAGREAVFRARGITKVYHMGEVDVHALRGVDLDLYRGEFVVLLGPSGSGKSTLLNILGGLDVPTSGHVSYLDHDLTEYEDAALTLYRREHVGFVFQFYNLIPSLTAQENVALVTDIAREPMDPLEALTLVGLAERKDHFPAQLSGGEQQRVAIARAVAKRPSVLLCDEPTGALDVTTGIVVLEAIDRVNRELGTTTAVITHNASIAAMADRVITLKDGRIEGVRRNERKVAARELIW